MAGASTSRVSSGGSLGTSSRIAQYGQYVASNRDRRVGAINVGVGVSNSQDHFGHDEFAGLLEEKNSHKKNKNNQEKINSTQLNFSQLMAIFDENELSELNATKEFLNSSTFFMPKLEEAIEGYENTLSLLGEKEDSISDYKPLNMFF